MIGRFAHADDLRVVARIAVEDALTEFRRYGPVILLSRFNADNLVATGFLVLALRVAALMAEPLVDSEEASLRR